MPKTFFTKQEYESRWEKVHDEMKRRGYDIAVIWAQGSGAYNRYGDVLWLTNYYSAHSGHEVDNNFWNARSFSAVVMQPGQVPALHNDELLEPQDWISTDRIESHIEDPIEGVAQDLSERGVKGKVALVGSDMLPCKYMWQLERHCPEIEFVPEDDLVASVRHVKSEAELDLFRKAGETATNAMNAMMEGLIAGESEAEAAAAGAQQCIRGGGIPFLLRVSHGKGKDLYNFSRCNHTGFEDTKPSNGDIVRGWLMGPMHFGYGYLDPGRTAVCGGKPTKEQRELIEAAAGIVDGVIAKIRPGVTAHELAREGDRLYEEAGEQWPLYGHSCGLYFERPIYGEETCTDDEVIEANMVCSSEAFLMRNGVGSAGFEQNFIVHEDGLELLTNTPMYFWD